MNHDNFVKDKLKAGRVVVGTWSIVAEPTLLEVMGEAGMDFMILDMEHGLHDLKSIENGVRALEHVGCSPLVRVPRVESDLVQNCLDIGAHGLVFPQIENAAGACRAVRACNYAPDGTRGYNPFTRGGGYGGRGGSVVSRNAFGFTSVIVENPRAYAEIDEILAIENLDMVYLGVYDMSVQLSCAGDVNHPDITRFVEDCTSRVRNAGKAVGVMVKSLEDVQTFISMGANFLVWGVDTFLIRQATQTMLHGVRGLCR